MAELLMASRSAVSPTRALSWAASWMGVQALVVACANVVGIRKLSLAPDGADAAIVADGDADRDAPGSSSSDAGLTYRAIVLADAPVAYWRLGEAPGEITAHDETGNGNDGRYL